MDMRSVLVYFWLGMVAGVLQRVEAGVGCPKYEFLTCGHESKKWDFCTPNSVGMIIRSVHLDLRHPNRYCRGGEGHLNFGLTKNRNRMWVFNYCFGTFIVCVETDVTTTSPTTSVSKEATSTTSSTTLLAILTSTKPFPGSYERHKMARETNDHQQSSNNPDGPTDNHTNLNNNGQKTSSNTTLLSHDTLVDHVTNMSLDSYEPRMLPRDHHVSLGQHNVTLEASDPHESSDTSSPSTGTLVLDPALKTLIMTGIITGGAFLIFLIILAAILILKCNSKGPDYESAENYARQPKTSTSELLETEAERSVYDVIPCDALRTPKVRKNSNVANNQRSVYEHGLNTVQGPSKGEYDLSMIRKEDENRQNEDVDPPENPYDHIMCSFKPVALNKDTYNQIHINRSPPKTTIESGVQTENSPADESKVGDVANIGKDVKCQHKLVTQMKDNSCPRNHNTL